jgi:HK97 family phage major capsid protein
MKTSIEIQHEMNAVLTRIREIDAAAKAENRHLTAEEQAQWDQGTQDYTDLLKAKDRQEFLEDHPAESDEDRRVWQLRHDKDAGPAQSEEEVHARDSRAYAQAFREYLSIESPKMISAETWRTLYTRARGISEEEKGTLRRLLSPTQYQAAMSVGSQTGGGFWVPDEMMAAVEKALLWFGGMRQFAEVLPTDTGADFPWPVYDDTGNVGRRLSENTAATQTDLAVGVRVLKAFMYSSDEVLVSQQLLQDWPVQAESILADSLGERIARIQNTEFTTYNAADGPQGLLPAVSTGVTAAAAAAVTADELRNLKYAVNRAYRDHPSSAYMTSDRNLRDAMGLQDGNGRYLFVPDPRDGGEPNIWGSRVVVNNDVPNAATGVTSWVYGKGAAYKIRTVKGFTLLRMDERYAPSLQVSFLGFARADGGYINAGQNPIQALVHP